MPLCKFSLIVTFIFYAFNLFPSFSGKDCLKSSFNIEVSHKGPPLGLFNNKLRIDKKDCVLIIEKEKFRYLRSKWELDVCRFPIHIKEGAGAINVHKKVRPSCDFSSENKDKFCNSLKDLKGVVQDYGLIFAKGEKENINSDHGKVYCSFLLINFYFDKDTIFGLQDDEKANNVFGDTFNKVQNEDSLNPKDVEEDVKEDDKVEKPNPVEKEAEATSDSSEKF